jgi:hypothetical protein
LQKLVKKTAHHLHWGCTKSLKAVVRGPFIQQQKIAILNPNNEDCSEINEGIVNILIQDESRTYYRVDPADYEGKSREKLYPIAFLNSLSPSLLPPRTLNLRINTIVIFFILQLLQTLQHDKFPTKIAFTATINKAQGQKLKHAGIYQSSPDFSLWPALGVIFPEPLRLKRSLLELLKIID